MIAEAIVSILKNNTAVSAIVGTRIHPQPLPLSSEFPAITYILVSDPYDRITGHPTYQIDCWATDYTHANQLKDVVKNALDGFSGTVNGINIEIIVPVDSREIGDSDPDVYHIPYDFKIIYRR